MSTKLTVVIFSLYIYQIIIYLKLMQYYVNYTYLNKEKKSRIIKMFKVYELKIDTSERRNRQTYH